MRERNGESLYLSPSVGLKEEKLIEFKLYLLILRRESLQP